MLLLIVWSLQRHILTKKKFRFDLCAPVTCMYLKHEIWKCPLCLLKLLLEKLEQKQCSEVNPTGTWFGMGPMIWNGIYDLEWDLSQERWAYLTHCKFLNTDYVSNRFTYTIFFMPTFLRPKYNRKNYLVVHKLKCCIQTSFLCVNVCCCCDSDTSKGKRWV